MQLNKSQQPDLRGTKEALFFASIQQRLSTPALSSSDRFTPHNALTEDVDQKMISLFLLRLLPVTYQEWKRKK
jgi:hypothetical protein